VKFKATLSFALESIKKRKLRTTLTTLGVVIGITAILAVTSLGEGFRANMVEQIEYFELDVVMVMPKGILTGSGLTFFTKENVTNIKQIENVITATPIMQKPFVKLYREDKNATSFLLAVNFTEFEQVYPGRLVSDEGNMPQPNETGKIALGYRVAHPESGQDFARAGDNITVSMNLPVPTSVPPYYELRQFNYTFTVASVLKQSGGASSLISFDDAIFTPLSVAETMFNTTRTDMIFVKVADSSYSEGVAEQIKDIFQDKVMALTPSVMIQRVGNVLNMAEVFLTSIAAIALLVAGVGIMNIMTVSVMERTREIGILKAVGAKSGNILTMFLAEAALIGLVGGLLGVPGGYALAYVLSFILTMFSSPQNINSQIPWQPNSFTITPVLSPIWVVGAIFFGIVVSILFGWYPARKASKMDPVQALRHE